MIDLSFESFDLDVAPGLRLPLRRMVRARRPPGEAVLLIHGASASSGTFVWPDPASDYLSSRAFLSRDVGPGLANHLFDNGFDVWLLDWRGGHRVARSGPVKTVSHAIDAVASEDIPRAFRRIIEVRGGGDHGRIHALGHCVGGMALAMSVGSGALAELVAAGRLGNVVLSTMGLFVRCPWEGLWKIQDRVLERLMGDALAHGWTPVLDPTAAEEVRALPAARGRQPSQGVWPAEFDRFFKLFPAPWLPCGHGEHGRYCRMLSFMYGKAYAEAQLPEAFHEDEFLMEQFSAIPLELYMHCGQNARRGFAAPIDSCDVAHEGQQDTLDRRYLQLKNFEGVSVTVYTGAENGLWHRDSVDRMWEWLCRRRQPGRSRKMVFANYAHQDLLWGRHREDETFPFISHALGCR